MYKFFLATVVSAVMVLNCIAQNDTVKQKAFNHYVGIQANELLRQLFDFNNNNTVINNPYLAVYSVTWKKINAGLTFGIGYSYKKTLDKDAPVGRESKLNDLSYRIGIEKKFTLGRRFEGGVSLDMIAGYKTDKTISLSVTNLGSQIDSSESTVSGKITTSGYGPHVFLGFHITEKIMLGTEATMYYSAKKEKQNILVVNTITNIFNNNSQEVNTSNFNAGTETDEFVFTVPVALFLIVKF